MLVHENISTEINLVVYNQIRPEASIKMNALKKFGNNTFSSLRVKNYRLYFLGHVISQSGTWMQTVALGWLVLQLTHSGAQLGSVIALQFVPLLIFGPWGGLVADRYDKRKILYFTQSAFGFLALSISILVFTEVVEIWMLYFFALGLGIVRVFDNPTRQTFVSELVDDNNVKNAVSLNSTSGNLARVIGPSIGGFLIAGLGIAFCFFFNALSYLATIFMLFQMNVNEFYSSHRQAKKSGQLIEGFKYVMGTPLIRSTLLMMAFIGTFAYEFQVSLPLLVEKTFNGDAASYAALLSAMGAGSVVGGLFAAGRHKIIPHHLADFVLLFGVSLVATALMSTLNLAIAGMFFVGFFSINVTSLANTMVQLESIPQMRGRVMSLWGMAMVGSTAIGGPIIGLIGQYLGPRFGLGIGGIVAIIAFAFTSGTLLKKRFYRIVPSWLQRENVQTEN